MVLVIVGVGGAPEVLGGVGLGQTAVVPAPIGQEGEVTRGSVRVTATRMDDWRERERERKRKR